VKRGPQQLADDADLVRGVAPFAQVPAMAAGERDGLDSAGPETGFKIADQLGDAFLYLKSCQKKNFGGKTGIDPKEAFD
jgi:hypothetical protein